MMSKKKYNTSLLIICFTTFCLLMFLCAQNLNLHTLILTNGGDEWAFHGSLTRIHKGIVNQDLRMFFGTGFFNYGFLYFLFNYTFSSIFFFLNAIELTILVPRIISSVSAIISLVFIYKLFKNNHLKKNVPLVLLFIVSMPAFWINAIIFHPDWPFVCMLIISIYYLNLDDFKISKNYWIAILFFSISFSLKIQVLIFFPILLTYPIIANKSNFEKGIKLILFSFSIIFLFRLFTNPYLFHPEGFNAFISGFKADMVSNKTNHGQGGTISLFNKIEMINKNYFNFTIVFIASITSLYSVFNLFKSKNQKFISILAINFLLALMYLLFFVNKSWQHYYLGVILIAIIILENFIFSYLKQYYTLLFSMLILSQSLNYSVYSTLVKNVFKSEDEIIPFRNIPVLLEKKVSPKSHILIVGEASFNFEQLGLSYDNIHLVYGPLNSGYFDKTSQLASNYHNFGFIEKDFIILSKLHKSENLINEELAMLKVNYTLLNNEKVFMIFKRND
jgi:hypothetical protein